MELAKLLFPNFTKEELNFITKCVKEKV